jgi:hypothetical protein
MRRTAGAGLLAVVVSIALSACGGDEGPNEPTFSGESCADAYTDTTFESIDDLPSTCRDREGATRAFATASYDCEDGRVLWWNDVAWGYLGEPAKLHAEGAELVPPEQEREACVSS